MCVVEKMHQNKFRPHPMMTMRIWGMLKWYKDMMKMTIWRWSADHIVIKGIRSPFCWSVLPPYTKHPPWNITINIPLYIMMIVWMLLFLTTHKERHWWFVYGQITPPIYQSINCHMFSDLYHRWSHVTEEVSEMLGCDTFSVTSWNCRLATCGPCLSKVIWVFFWKR